MIILGRARHYIYVKELKNNWIRYTVFSLIASAILTFLQFYTFEHLGNLNDNMDSAFSIGISTFLVFIVYPIARIKINHWSN